MSVSFSRSSEVAKLHYCTQEPQKRSTRTKYIYSASTKGLFGIFFYKLKTCECAGKKLEKKNGSDFFFFNVVFMSVKCFLFVFASDSSFPGKKNYLMICSRILFFLVCVSNLNFCFIHLHLC